MRRVLFAILAAGLCAAQPTRSLVTFTHVKPDMLQEWLDIQKLEVIPALKKAGVTRRTVVQTVFGNVYEFVVVVPFEKYSELEGHGPIPRLLAAKLRRCVTGERTFVNLSQPDLAIPTDPKDPPQVMVSSVYRAAPGKRQEYLSFVRTELLPVYRKARIAGFLVSQRGFGSSANEIVLSTYYKQLADINSGPPLVQVLGREAAGKIVAKSADLATLVETVVRRRVNDLSF
ncbi:MAG: hypothetical protein ACRD96_29200 [Bryobacteraceae bacterium]